MIQDLLQNKTAKERASIKGQEIAKLNSIPKIKVGDIWVEITEMRAIEGGMELYARAWDSKGQIGFGKDGTVDLEKFVFKNPFIMVSDGTSEVRIAPLTGTPYIVNGFKEDLEGAILQVLKDTIVGKKQKSDSSNIVSERKPKKSHYSLPDRKFGIILRIVAKSFL